MNKDENALYLRDEKSWNQAKVGKGHVSGHDNVKHLLILW